MSTPNPLSPGAGSRSRSRSAKVVAASISSAALMTAGLALGPGVAGAQNGNHHDDDGVLWLNDQYVEVTNEGWAAANSGWNEAVGNASTNDASTAQSGVAGSQTATVSNESDGSADITTGGATASGNESETSVSQTYTPGTPVTDEDEIVNIQTVVVSNYGEAKANTGGNQAVGNASVNTAYASQSSASGTTITATVSNASAGSASVSTGTATASGNVSSTTVTQN